MSTEEKNAAEKLAETVKRIPAESTAYLVGVADGMLRMVKEREAESNADNHS